jgi:tetratricopeptide (TPR) repeat protein
MGTYIGRVLSLARQIAGALEYAHKQNIVHGDLKPSNVLLTPDAIPLLLDFNLSQDFTSDVSLRGGTLPYMPPEHLQLVAENAALHENTGSEVASDVYSFGALLYELLAGVAPYHDLRRANNPAAMATLMLAEIEKGPPSVRRHNRFVSVRLESLVLRCLSRDKAKRPATISEVKHALERETRPWVGAALTARIRPLMFSAAASIPLVILTGTGTYIATRPPGYLANYEEGMRLASFGQLDDAVAQFTSSVRLNPSFRPARFQLAKTFVAQGEFDLAINELGRLARSGNDTQSMEYLGYCFNLKGVSISANPWYERALQNGAGSMQLYNNLGASYVEGSSTLSLRERLDRSESFLMKALKLSPSSITIRINILRNSCAKSTMKLDNNPIVAWPHARSLIADAPDDPLVKYQVARWYQAALAQRRENQTDDRDYSGDAPLEARKRFEAVCAELREQNNGNSAPALGGKSVRASFGAKAFFLEPLSER